MENYSDEMNLKLFWFQVLSFLGAIALDYLVVFPGETTWSYCVVMQAGFPRRFKSVQFESFAKGLRRVKKGFKVVCYRIIKDGRHIIFFALKHPSAKPSQKVMRRLAQYQLLEGYYLGPDFFAPEGNKRHPGNCLASAPSANSAPCNAWPNNLNNNYDRVGDDPAEEFDPTNEVADTIFSDVDWLTKTEVLNLDAHNGDPIYEGEQDWQPEFTFNPDLAQTNHNQETGPDPQDPEDKTSDLVALAHQMEDLVPPPNYDENPFGDEILNLQRVAGALGFLNFPVNNTNAQQQNLQFNAQNNNNEGIPVSAPTQPFGCVSDQDWLDQNVILEAIQTESNDDLRRKIKSGEYIAAEEILQQQPNTNNEVNPYFTAEDMVDELDHNVENTDPTSRVALKSRGNHR